VADTKIIIYPIDYKKISLKIYVKVSKSMTFSRVTFVQTPNISRCCDHCVFDAF